MPYKNRKDDRKHAKRYYEAHREARDAYLKAYKRRKRIELRKEALARYGGPVCVCCGETNTGFLTLDHKNNNGAKHRKELFGYRAGGAHFVRWLKHHGWPDVGLQVLCWNCNCGRAFNNGICPHKEIT